MDNAGNMSEVYKTKNPYYKDLADESDENPAEQLPVNAEGTKPGNATGTVTEHTKMDSDGNTISGNSLAEQTKLETVERQLETAKVEVKKPFAQEAELAEKLERLSALNALLNMDEKGNDAIGMDDDAPAAGADRMDTEKVKRKEETL